MFRLAHLIAVLLSIGTLATMAFGVPPLLLRQPALSQDAIVFVFAGDLWRVPREGGDAVRLTAGGGLNRLPAFSPDGSQIAFTAEYDGNVDVYVMPAGGGIPVRLTSHPNPDLVAGWTPDGKSVLFASDRAVPTDGARLYTVPAGGGPATELPLPIAAAGSFSPDASRLAYVPTIQWQQAWKRYRGGQTRRIWLARLADSSIEELPHGDASEFDPMWIGDTVYFLSDRDGAVTLYAYDLKSKQTRRCIENSGLDIKSASAGPGAIVFDQFGALRLYDLASGKVTTVEVRLAGDLAEVRPRYKKVGAGDLTHGRPSPTGKRAVFEAHGEIITVPAEKGDPRNLTQTPGVAERDPAWSPDGKTIAYFSDESGEYQLHLRDPSGLGEVRKINLGEPPSFFYHPTWSPDSKHLAYADKRGKLWLMDVANGTAVLVDTQPIVAGFEPDPCAFSWSPDSRWLTYSRILKNRLTAIFVYGLEDGFIHQITDGMSDTSFPQFSDSGEYLYFAASTDSGPANGWGDLSAVNRPVTANIYLAVLNKTNASPLAAESDEEMPKAEKAGDNDKDKERDALKNNESAASDSTQTNAASKTAEAKSGDEDLPPRVTIDFDNIGQRIVALPMPARNYKGLYAGKSNVVFVLEGPTVDSLDDDGSPKCVVQRFDLAKRKAEKFTDGVTEFAVTGDREKVLFKRNDDWFLTKADGPASDDGGKLTFDGFQIPVDPRAEWRQMYHETWRIERDFFYDPAHHGLDINAAERRYQPYLAGLASRADLNFLFEEMLGELTVGHMFIHGGDLPEERHIKVGLLGADFVIEKGHYRFARIFNGENWNPDLRAPLTEPGVNVAVGDFLLAVDGRPVPGTAELYTFFQDKADTLVTLRVGTNTDDSSAHDVKVKPVGNEHGLRYRAWVEDNRRTVDVLSSNRLAYVHLPDTQGAGYRAFNRYFFAQVDRQGFIIDERFNHGGLLADYVVDYLHRKVLSNVAGREGMDYSLPAGASSGPKVMMINEFSGSGGDALPWYFRKLGIGPLVGRRTWGGLVGIGGYPELMDGGTVMAPHWAIYGTIGQFEVENKGVKPDFDVELDPKAWRAGRDFQLEKAVQVALESLATNPPAVFQRPTYPNYHQQ